MYVCIAGTLIPTVPLSLFNAPIVLNLHSSPNPQSYFIALLGCPFFRLSTYTTPTQPSISLQIPPLGIFPKLLKQNRSLLFFPLSQQQFYMPVSCLKLGPLYYIHLSLSITCKDKHPHFKLQTHLQPPNVHLNNSLDGRNFLCPVI